MSGFGWTQILILLALLCVSTPLLGSYMAKVYGGGKAPGDRVFGPIERTIYRICGIDPNGEQTWRTYALSLLVFSLVGVLLTYGILRFQAHLPFNPNKFSAVSPGSSFNTSISFLTNTNWQDYAGESTMSQLSQFFALVSQQFLSAAVGLAVVVALIRGLIRRRSRTLGSFWVDTTRSVIRILLPIAFVGAIVLISQGALENFHTNTTYPTVVAANASSSAVKGTSSETQTIIGGPIASQDAIEMAGDNGGGYTNANNANPLQNPTGLSNILLIWLTLMIAFALPWTFGKMVKSRAQGLAVLASMVVLWFGGTVAMYAFEGAGNPHSSVDAVSQSATTKNGGGGNLEGKEQRFGTVGSALNNVAVTDTSSGGAGGAIESDTPLGGGTALTNMLLGEVSPGGTGSGLYGKLVLALLSVFIAGLMVGRTPEYLGKKIQAAEMKLVVIYIVVVPLVILAFASISIVSGFALKDVSASGPHGLSEVVYAFTEASNNNGSAFAGLTSNTQWYNTTLAICMFVGRFFLIIPVLAIAGSLGRKRYVPPTAGTFATGTPLFAGLLLAVTVVLVGLTYFPILALGPIVEHLAGNFHL
jgi:potassium-transporting ATPase potassium-binding subunit